MNLQRMDNAVKLNKLIKEKSSEAQLLLLNLPPPAKDESGDYHCILCFSLRVYPIEYQPCVILSDKKQGLSAWLKGLIMS
jgi:hypothetical protein